MLLDERRNRILKVIEQKGFVSLPELADQFRASESTVRRDLEYLDSIGQVRRTRGGAAYVGESLSAFDERRSQATAEKLRIAQAAAEMIEPDEAVLLDGGTTTLEVARHLIGKSLQVVTNSLPIVNLLASQSQIDLLVIGGFLYPKTGVFLGPTAVAALETVHIRRLFMSVGGITADGLFNSNSLLVETERKMIDAAEEVVVVSDSSKLGHSALAHLCRLDVVDRLVTDAGITAEWKDVFAKAQVDLTVV
ncbi:MAG TPA: DeoR/GlpR family DNA-binding transcription regulator [Planctomycetaceae bacterium]|nr:DeoR/GlpR family DNA-binding transcription regulator [Planctomycetaceae bacterium]